MPLHSACHPPTTRDRSRNLHPMTYRQRSFSTSIIANPSLCSMGRSHAPATRLPRTCCTLGLGIAGYLEGFWSEESSIETDAVGGHFIAGSRAVRSPLRDVSRLAILLQGRDASTLHIEAACWANTYRRSALIHLNHVGANT